VIEQNDTIAAISTPLGEGGLGVIRLSGPDALKITNQIFHSSLPTLSKAKSHTLHVGWIEFNQERIDQAVVGLFRAPHSYTGEDVVEISCHGSPFVLKEILSLCVAKGARLAAPGEFTQRAYLNGKLDLLQAEAVADLIHSGSKRARQTAAHHLEGELSRRLQKIRGGLIEFLAHLEANLDFVEEDIPGLPRKIMIKGLGNSANEIEKLLSVSLKSAPFREGIHIALIGRANVGKSSLFNSLLAKERAIVTEIPGTTRDVLEEKLHWDGFSIILSDTAGLKKPSDRLDKLGMDRTEKTKNLASIVLFVLDGSEEIGLEDENIFKSLKEKPFVVVLNKLDRGLKVEMDVIKKKWPGIPVVATSAKDGTGLSELKNAVLEALSSLIPVSEGEEVLTNMRHIAHLEKTVEYLAAAIYAAERGKTEEAIAVDVRKAAEEIGFITGENVGEDVLNSIFGRFCVGK